MEATSAEAVEVEVPPTRGTKQQPAEPAAAAAAAPAAVGGWRSATALWVLFALGWLLPPCWWLGVAAGLRAGSESERLIKRRKGLSGAQRAAWTGCVVMSCLSAAALILAASMLAGRRSTPQEGPFWLTLAGPASSFPDLTDPTKLALVAGAVHSALSLPASYAATNIAVWLQASAPLPPPPSRRRRGLLAASDDSEDATVRVLGYTLDITAELPATDVLQQAMADPQANMQLASQLEASGFVAPEHAGELSTGLTDKRSSEEVISQFTTSTAAADGSSTPPPALVPIGRKDCQGGWSAWGACSAACGDGTQARTYATASPAKAGGAACPAVNGQGEARVCNLQPCPVNCTGMPLAGGRGWDCCAAAGTAHGALCSGACLDGQLGEATAVCNDGVYEPVQGCFPDCELGWQDVPGSCNASSGSPHGWRLQAFNATLAGDTAGHCASTQGLTAASTRALPCLAARLLIVHAAPSYAADVRTKLNATGSFTVVDLWNGGESTPTLADLQEYDSVLAFSDGGWQDQTALGDSLAGFWSAGGRGVVLATFANTGGSDVRGAWASGGFRLLSYPAGQAERVETQPLILNPAEAGSPLLVGVSNLTASSGYHSSGTPVAGSVTVASWGSGVPLIVRAVRDGRNLVELNLYPPSADAREDFWTGDGTSIIRNALLYTLAEPPLNCSGAPSEAVAGVDAWGCDNIAHGANCTAQCNTTVALGMAVAACNNGVLTVVQNCSAIDCELGWQDVPSSCNASCDNPEGWRLQAFNATLAGNTTAAYCATQGLTAASTKALPCILDACCPGFWVPTTTCSDLCFVANNTRSEVFNASSAIPDGRRLLAALVTNEPGCNFTGTTREVPCARAEPCRSSRGQWQSNATGACSLTCGGGTKPTTYVIEESVQFSGSEDVDQAILNGTAGSDPCNTQACPLNCSGVPSEATAGVDAWGCDNIAHGANCTAQCNTTVALGVAVAGCTNGTLTLVQNCSARVECFPSETYAYTASSLSAAFVDACLLPSATTLLASQDDSTAAISLPFNYTLYATRTTSAWISTNGVLGIGSVASSSLSNSALPSTSGSTPKNALFGFWDDLKTTAPGVCTATTGTAPNRQFVATWKQVFLFGGSAATQSFTFSIILHETSNAAAILFGNMTSTAAAPNDQPRADGNSATIGLQDSAGRFGVQWSYNTAVAGGLSHKGVDFTPRCVEKACTGSPAAPANAVAFLCSAVTLPGSSCATTCASGYTAGGSGAPSATCSGGSWGQVAGDCVPDCELGWQDVPSSCNASCDNPEGWRLQAFNATLAGNTTAAYCATQGLTAASTKALPCILDACCPGFWVPTTTCSDLCFVANNTRSEVFNASSAIPDGRRLLAALVTNEPGCNFTGTTREVPCARAEPCRSSRGQWQSNATGACSLTCGGGTKPTTYVIEESVQFSGSEDVDQAILNGTAGSDPCNTQACPLNCSGVPSEATAGVDAWGCDNIAHGANCTAQCNTTVALGVAVAACTNGTLTVFQNCTAVCTGSPATLANATAFSCGTTTLHGATCNTTCASGYTAGGSGAPSAACGADGSWDAVAGGCVQIVCATTPTAPANAAAFSCGNSTLPGATCNTTCASGYTAGGSGAPSATCGADGSWDAVAGGCVQIS